MENKHRIKQSGLKILVIFLLFLGFGGVILFFLFSFALPIGTMFYASQKFEELMPFEQFPLDPFRENIKNIKVSSDQKNIAYVIERVSGDLVVQNRELKPYMWDKVEPYFTLSDDGEHLAYIAKKGSNYYVVKDNTYYGPYSSYIKGAEEIMSSNGDHFGVGVTLKNGKTHMLMNGNLTEDDYCCISNTSPIFSADGTRWSYGVKETDDAEKWSIVIDGEDSTYPQIGSLEDGEQEYLFSPNSENFMYVVLEDESTQYVVYNGFPEKKYYAVRDLTFSPDGKHYAYIAVIEGEPGKYNNRVVYNGKELAPEYMITDIYFTPDSSHLVYTAYLDDKREKMKLVMEIDEKEIIDNAIINPVLTSDGEKLAYVNLTEDERLQVVFEGERFGEYDDILGEISISPDENKVLYIAKKGDKNTLVINNEEISAADHNVWYAGWNNLGEYWYVVKNEEEYETTYEIYIGEKMIDKGAEYRSFSFTNVGNHYSYVIKDGEDESEEIVLDGEVIDSCAKVYINEDYSLFEEGEDILINYFCLEEDYDDSGVYYGYDFLIKPKNYKVEDN